jgi:Domain of unknown function (DUF4399)
MSHSISHRSRATISAATLALALGVLVACGGAEAPQKAEEVDHAAMGHEEAAMPAPSTAPRVFFANVEDGDEVVSPVHLEFGIENFEIVPAQTPPVVEEGKGHHHLAINAGCKPAGEAIEKAAPWVHFGDGSSSFDVQLPPGPAELTLQVGDGEHRTLDEPGLCATIHVTVVATDDVEEDAGEATQ